MDYAIAPSLDVRRRIAQERVPTILLQRLLKTSEPGASSLKRSLPIAKGAPNPGPLRPTNVCFGQQRDFCSTLSTLCYNNTLLVQDQHTISMISRRMR
jgi:hypothetical protein